MSDSVTPCTEKPGGLQQPTGFLCPWDFQARILEWLPFLTPGDLPDPSIEPRSPTMQADSLPSELPGKPRS